MVAYQAPSFVQALAQHRLPHQRSVSAGVRHTVAPFAPHLRQLLRHTRQPLIQLLDWHLLVTATHTHTHTLCSVQHTRTARSLTLLPLLPTLTGCLSLSCCRRSFRNIFFICANLLQIVLILVDRRQVQLSEEEQRVYDLVFADVFSPQEFKKLRKSH